MAKHLFKKAHLIGFKLAVNLLNSRSVFMQNAFTLTELPLELRNDLFSFLAFKKNPSTVTRLMPP